MNVSVRAINEKDECIGIFRYMYASYIADLKPYNKYLKTDDVSLSADIKQIFDKTANISVYLIEDLDCPVGRGRGYLIVGFILIGWYPNSYGKDDIYIQEFYIARDHRKKGYGREAANKLLEVLETDYKYYWHGDISMFILEENLIARLFWRNVLEPLGYKDIASMGKIKYEPQKSPNMPELRFRYYSM